MVLISDAAPHGVEFGPVGEEASRPAAEIDSHPEGVAGQTVTSVLKQMYEKDIDLLICHIKSEVTRPMEQVFIDTHRSIVEEAGETDSAAPLRRGVDLFDGEEEASPSGYRILFVLDESGSMSWDNRWDSAVAAYTSFLRTRMARTQNVCNDMVAVVQFSHEARTAVDWTKLSEAPTLHMIEGGTSFQVAMEEAERCLARSDGLYGEFEPIVVFMSDGEDYEDGARAAAQVLNRMFDKYPTMQAHILGFGSDFNDGMLRVVAGDKGKFDAAADAAALTRKFVHIARDCTGSVTEGLVKRFSDKLRDMVTTTMVIDFL